jgi:S1-C subfamily serine protease
MTPARDRRSRCRAALSQAILAAALLAAVPLAASDPLADLEAAQQALHDRVVPSVVYLTSDGGIGSGFFAARGLIITNRHVVGTAQTVGVVLHDGRKLTGTVVERAAGDIDLALVRVSAGDVEPLELSLPSPRVGAWIASVGHGVDSPWTFTTGMVSNVYKNQAGWPVLQTQIPLNPGSSGSPIVDRRGKVVGIVAKGMTDANSVNFAIGARVAAHELHGLPAVAAGLVIRAPTGTAVFVDGQLAGKGPELTVELEPGSHKVSAIVAGTLRERVVECPGGEAVDLR